MQQKKYLIVRADRKHADIFTFSNGLLSKHEWVYDDVPQKVKHGQNSWDAQDKIFRHIEEHLHRHLSRVGTAVLRCTRINHIDGIIIGSHKELVNKIQKYFPYPLNKKVVTTYITGLKDSPRDVLKQIKYIINSLEKPKEGRVYAISESETSREEARKKAHQVSR